MVPKVQHKVGKRARSKTSESKQQLNKKTLYGSIVLIVISMLASVNSIRRTVESTENQTLKQQRPQIAGVEIPREVIRRMQQLKSTTDRENVIREWAASEGIEFKYKEDGSYVAIRDGEEYVLRGADPDYAPNEDDSQQDGEPFAELPGQPGSADFDAVRPEISEQQDEQSEYN